MPIFPSFFLIFYTFEIECNWRFWGIKWWDMITEYYIISLCRMFSLLSKIGKKLKIKNLRLKLTVSGFWDFITEAWVHKDEDFCWFLTLLFNFLCSKSAFMKAIPLFVIGRANSTSVDVRHMHLELWGRFISYLSWSITPKRNLGWMLLFSLMTDAADY